MKIIIFTLLIFATTIRADYFWRDYFGTIPSDAVQGGTTIDGQPTYIGQAVNRQTKNMVVGQIYKGDPHVTVLHLPNEKSDFLVRILCSHDHKDLVWIKTDINNLHLLTECNQISAGYYEEAPLVIGRANYQGATYVGHIFDYPPKNWRFFISSSNGIRIEYKEFEVLAHNCKTSVASTPSIAVKV